MKSTSDRYALILAAGQGTRMKSRKPKVLHPLCGKPLIAHVLDKLADLGPARTWVVVGHGSEQVQEALAGYGVEFVQQQPQQGTGHAMMVSAPQLETLSGSLLVLYGDIPLVPGHLLSQLLETREATNADQVLLTAEYADPSGYGRIVRDADGAVTGIVEEKDATPEQRTIREINTGIQCFAIDSLLSALSKLSRGNAAGEYYLTDLVEIFRQQGKKVLTLSARKPEETAGVNTREELASVELELRARIASRWMAEGVTLMAPGSIYIDESVVIGPDTVVHPGAVLEGKTRIGRDCTIGAYSHLRDAVLEKEVTVDHCCVIRQSRVGKQSRIGPFAHLRQGCSVASQVRIGNFVEVKNSQLGRGSKSAHLSYLGDASIGREVNIGAGTITCNYDGKEKHPTVIEDGVFIGSDAQLIAPVTIGRGAYVAAGSSITEDVPEKALAIARGRQVNKEGWAKKRP